MPHRASGGPTGQAEAAVVREWVEALLALAAMFVVALVQAISAPSAVREFLTSGPEPNLADEALLWTLDRLWHVGTNSVGQCPGPFQRMRGSYVRHTSTSSEMRIFDLGKHKCIQVQPPVYPPGMAACRALHNPQKPPLNCKDLNVSPVLLPFSSLQGKN